jgi:hypothetical protein
MQLLFLPGAKPGFPTTWRDCMKSSCRSPDGGSSVARNTKIEPSEAAFCAWWGTGSMPIRSFQTVSEAEFSEVRRSNLRPHSSGPLAPDQPEA